MSELGMFISDAVTVGVIVFLTILFGCAIAYCAIYDLKK